MGAPGRTSWKFGDFELAQGKLLRDGRAVRLQPQPARVLELLLSRAGELVSREEIRAYIWNDATFVEFDQGLNYCIRQIRIALGDDASNPSYVETLPKQGYRLVATVCPPEPSEPPEPPEQAALAAPPSVAPLAGHRGSRLLRPMVAVCSLLLLTVGYFLYRAPAPAVKYTQLTDFTDSASAPALSPDGRLVAFIGGNLSFLSPDQIYIKPLPGGEARQLTDDPRLKYNIAFSPDGSRIAYTVLDPPTWATYSVSVLGGEPRLMLPNAAGLTWLNGDQLLFSRVRSGVHMGIVTGTSSGNVTREIYFPPHERGMAHYSYPSPDRRFALVVEMNSTGGWGPCRLISLNGSPEPRQVGPAGECTSAAWSHLGDWMYFTVAVDGAGHLWRQRFPDGKPQQITLGPTEESGVTVDPGDKSLVTALGVSESTVRIHEPTGDRSLSSEGEIVAAPPPLFRGDNQWLYYLLVRRSAGPGAELWRTSAETGKSEPVLPGISMAHFDISRDGKLCVYVAGTPPLVWLAPVDRSAAPRRIGDASDTSPHFGPEGQILFRRVEGKSNYLEQMNEDGAGRTKVVSYPIVDLHSISPGGRWAVVGLSREGAAANTVAIPLAGGPPTLLCESVCYPAWAPNGNFLYVPIEEQSRMNLGRSLAIPLGPDEAIPRLPPTGLNRSTKPELIPGAQLVNRAHIVPARDPGHFAYVNTAFHRNLFRITLP